MEHLTKEEIINKYWDDPTNLLDAVPKIMDEYSNQEKRIEAIAFAEWIDNCFNKSILGYTYKKYLGDKFPSVYTIAELYDLYLQ